MKKLFALVLAIAMIMTCSLAMADRLADIQAAGKVVIATSPDWPPYEYIDDEGNVVGTDVLMMQWIAEQLGVALEIQPLAFDACLAAVGRGDVDLMVAGLTFDEERLNAMELTGIYWNEGDQGLLVRKGEGATFNSAEAFDGKYVYPEVPEVSNTVDFGRIYPDAKGDIAYALTYATCDGPLKIKTDSEMTVFVNGEQVNEKEIFLAEGDVVLLKLLKEDSWKFTFDEEAAIGIPFMLSNREGGDKWLTLGSFGKARAFDIKYGPEYEIQFTNTYRNEFGEEMFWKLTERDDYLRPYLQSRFFGQWFYALMVGTHGLLRAAEAINEPRYKDYFVGSNELMATYYNYMQNI